MSVFPSYSTGTVSIAANGTVVTGVGTNWTGVNAMPGDILQVGAFQTVVSDVTSSTALAIPTWGGGAQSGAAYKIWKTSPLRFAGGQAAADVSALIAALNTKGFFVFVGPDEAAPDPSYGDEGQFALKPSTFQIWQMTGGAWVLYGTFRGFGTPAAYDNVATYELFNVVTVDGSSYVYINSTPSAGHAPPNATYWEVLASKGTDGAPGGAGATGPGYGGTSTSSVAIGTGSKVFVTQAGLAWLPGARVRVTSAADVTKFMEGLVTAYAGTSLTVNVTLTGGSGTLASWNINAAGEPGTADFVTVRRFEFNATGGQTTFSGADVNGHALAYTPGFIDVAVSGLLLAPSDFTATDGTSVVIDKALSATDVVYINASLAYNPADTLAKSQNGGDITDKVAFRSQLPNPGALFGLTLSAAGATATFGIAAGYAADSTNVRLMRLASAYTKTTSAWAVGSGNGALDTGAIANNTWYHVFEIMRPDTGVVDVLISLSATAPAMPGGGAYTLFRRIGSMRTNGSAQWIKFIQSGDEFWWDSPDGGLGAFVNAILGVTTATTQAPYVPVGVIVDAIINAQLVSTSADCNALFSPLDVSDQAASGCMNLSARSGQLDGAQFRVRTNASAQIRLRVTTTTATIYATTSGWVDRRGKDA